MQPTTRSSGARSGRLHLCFVSVEYRPGPLNGIARVVHTLATGLAAQGHVVRVVTRGDGHDRVDLEDGVWVHRPVTRESGDLYDEPGYEPGLEYQYTVLRELRAIRERRPVDVVQLPNFGAGGLAVLRDGTFPTVESPRNPKSDGIVAGFSSTGTDSTPAVQAPIATKLMCPNDRTPELPTKT